jgi:hypothetical protein
MMSVERAIREGRMQPDQEVLLIRNDADAKGLHREYVQKLVDEAEKSPDHDVFVGALRWETEKFRDYPGFAVVANFMEVLRAVAGRNEEYNLTTSGANSTVRMSTLAAVGGLGESDYLGAGSDDLELGHRIIEARGGPGGVIGNRSGSGSSGGARVSRILNLRERIPVGSRTRSTKRPLRYVRGAQIDTDATRLIDIYRRDETLSDAWADFDQGGHNVRDNASDRGLFDREDPLTDIDDIARRIETNISDLSTAWYQSPVFVQAGLRFMFPEFVPEKAGSRRQNQGERVYEVLWVDGQCTFKFTPEGKEWLQAKLLRDSKGRWDGYGSRVRRALYHETRPGSKRKPASNRPRFVRSRA